MYSYAYEHFVCMYACVPLMSELLGVPSISEPPCGCWDSNPGDLQSQQVLLTTESPLQPESSVCTDRASDSPPHWCLCFCSPALLLPSFWEDSPEIGRGDGFEKRQGWTEHTQLISCTLLAPSFYTPAPLSSVPF